MIDHLTIATQTDAATLIVAPYRLLDWRAVSRGKGFAVCSISICACICVWINICIYTGILQFATLVWIDLCVASSVQILFYTVYLANKQIPQEIYVCHYLILTPSICFRIILLTISVGTSLEVGFRCWLWSRCLS